MMNTAQPTVVPQKLKDVIHSRERTLLNARIADHLREIEEKRGIVRRLKSDLYVLERVEFNAPSTTDVR